LSASEAFRSLSRSQTNDKCRSILSYDFCWPTIPSDFHDTRATQNVGIGRRRRRWFSVYFLLFYQL